MDTKPVPMRLFMNYEYFKNAQDVPPRDLERDTAVQNESHGNQRTFQNCEHNDRERQNDIMSCGNNETKAEPGGVEDLGSNIHQSDMESALDKIFAVSDLRRMVLERQQRPEHNPVKSSSVLTSRTNCNSGGDYDDSKSTITPFLINSNEENTPHRPEFSNASVVNVKTEFVDKDFLQSNPSSEIQREKELKNYVWSNLTNSKRMKFEGSDQQTSLCHFLNVVDNDINDSSTVPTTDCDEKPVDLSLNRKKTLQPNSEELTGPRDDSHTAMSSMEDNQEETQKNDAIHSSDNSGLEPVHRELSHSFQNKTSTEVNMTLEEPYAIPNHTRGDPYTCSVCDKTFTRKREFNTHMRFHTSERPYVCYLCNNTYKKRFSLTKHILADHPGEMPYKCTVCDKTFTSFSSLSPHLTSHKRTSLVRCFLCKMSFTDSGQLNSHMEMHTTNGSFMKNFKTLWY